MDENQLKKYKKYAISRLEKEFKKSCREGNLELVEFFLFSEELPVKVDPLVDNCAGLRWSCEANQLEIVKFFLESPKLTTHAKINVNSDEPFRKAAENGSLEVVQYLMSKNEYKEKIDVHQWSDYALRKATINGHMEMVEYLLFSPEMSENCNINAVTLNEIIYSGTKKIEMIKLMLTDERLKNSYEITAEDTKVLLTSEFAYDILEYLIVDLEKKLKINPKIHLEKQVQKLIEMVQSKDKLSKELSIKENTKEMKKTKI